MDTNPQQPNEPNSATPGEPSVENSPVTESTPQTGFAPEAPSVTESPETPQPQFDPFGATSASTQAAAGNAPLVAGAPLVATAPVSKPHSNTKKIIIIVMSIVGFLGLAAAGVAIYIALNTVTAADYAAAATQYNKVRDANTELASKTSTYSSGYSTLSDDEFSKAESELATAETALKTENEALGKLKAMSVGEGKTKYDTFNGKLKEQLTFLDELVSSLKTIRPAMVKCNTVSSAKTSTEIVTKLKTCVSDIGSLGTISNKEISDFVAAIHTGYGNYVTAYEQRSALASPFGADYTKYTQLTADMNAATKSITAAQTTYKEGLDARKTSIGLADSANSIKDFLDSKNV